VIAFVVLASAASLVYTGYLFREYRMLSREVNEVVRSAEALGRETTFIPLTRNIWTQPRALSPVLWHAIDYAALEKHDVNLLN